MKQKQAVKLPILKNKPYYRTRFKNVTEKVFDVTWAKKPKFIELLDRHLDDPSECHTGFFLFLIYKVHDIGLNESEELVEKYGLKLVPFFIEHENKKKWKLNNKRID